MLNYPILLFDVKNALKRILTNNVNLKLSTFTIYFNNIQSGSRNSILDYNHETNAVTCFACRQFSGSSPLCVSRLEECYFLQNIYLGLGVGWGCRWCSRCSQHQHRVPVGCQKSQHIELRISTGQNRLSSLILLHFERDIVNKTLHSDLDSLINTFASKHGRSNYFLSITF